MPKSLSVNPEIRNETSELRLLLEICCVLDEGTELDHLEKVLGLIAKYTGMMRGTLSLLDKKNKEAVVEVSFGLRHAEKKRGHYKVGEGITGKVLETGKPMAVPNISSEPLFLNKMGARNPQKEELSFLCVPILSQGQAIGALSADRLFADSISLNEDMRLLQIIASMIARAVQIRSDFNEMQVAVVEENRRLHALLHTNFDASNMVGNSGSMHAVLEELQQVTASNATVLIRGESGTGKELIASIIHANSPRFGKPFIKVNCAALPEGLVESELFGHERGAFTGATGAKKGRFEMAHGGTLFLDEVGDMTPLTQAKLLRALQEKEFERVGGTQTLRVDVRMIAATNRDLEKMVASGDFRQDLYYRLSVFPVMLPPLRERKDDIMPLVNHFVDRFSKENQRKILRISSRATNILISYSWPGNIRELENVIQRAVVVCGLEGIIDVQHLPANIQSDSIDEGHPKTLDEAISSLEQRLIIQALNEEDGNMVKAAEKLGITERIMGLRMKKYGLNYKDFRG